MEGYLCSQAAFYRHNVHPKEHIEQQANSNQQPMALHRFWNPW